jgi:ribonucleoside-diphosphate reductase alpha chain
MSTSTAASRRSLPEQRKAISHKFEFGGYTGYLTVGFYDDNTPGELFITMNNSGSTIEGLLNTIASMTSLLLQHGVPLDVLVKKFSFMRFEPSGATTYPPMRQAHSIIDYLFRWLADQQKHGFPGDAKTPEPATKIEDDDGVG